MPLRSLYVYLYRNKSDVVILYYDMILYHGIIYLFLFIYFFTSQNVNNLFNSIYYFIMYEYDIISFVNVLFFFVFFAECFLLL